MCVRIRRLLAGILTFGGMACGSTSEPGPADQLTVRTESAHFVYLSAPADAADPAWMEQYIAWLNTALGDSVTGKLEFRKYRDRVHMQRMTGRNTNGFAEPGTNRFHTIWPEDNHEVVHVVVILRFGHPPALFNEGIAVAHQTIPPEGILYAQWNRQNVHDIARSALASNRIPALNTLLASPQFFNHDTNLTYPLSGSFVRYLIDTHGLAPVRAYFANATFDDSVARTRQLFQAAYGFSVDVAWAAWLDWLTP
jgi:hypothetical protein